MLHAKKHDCLFSCFTEIANKKRKFVDILKQSLSQTRLYAIVVVVVVDINSPNVGTPRLRVEQIFNLTIRTKVLM